MKLRFVSSIVAAAMAVIAFTGTGINGIDKNFSGSNVAFADMNDYVQWDHYYRPQGNFTYNSYYLAKWTSDCINDPYQGCSYNTVYYVGNNEWLYNSYGDEILNARWCYDDYSPSQGHWRLEKVSLYTAYYGGYRIVYSSR